MLFIEKQGVYGHGIWWFGTDIAEAINTCNQLAQQDCDDWHTWNVYEFVEQTDPTMDPKHILQYTTKRKE